MIKYAIDNSNPKKPYVLLEDISYYNKRYKNKKAFFYKQFALEAAKGNIRVLPGPYSRILHDQLQKITYETPSDGRM